MKWLYTVDHADPNDDFMDRLQEKGQYGWELVTVLLKPDGSRVFYFKKPHDCGNSFKPGN